MALQFTFWEEKSASHILVDPTLLQIIHTKKGTRKKNVLIKQKILCIHKLAQRTTIKAFFYLDEITQYYSDTMKIHVLSDIAQEILHHEINTYLSFGCT